MLTSWSFPFELPAGTLSLINRPSWTPSSRRIPMLTISEKSLGTLPTIISEEFGHLLLFYMWADLGSDVPPPLSILSECLIVFLSHSLKITSVRSHVHIEFVLLHKGLTQVIESSNFCTVQVHVPLQCGIGQIVLKVMDKDLMIMGIGGHLPHIHRKMVFRAGGPFVFFEVWDLELVRYLDIRHQAQIINILLEYFSPTEGLISRYISSYFSCKSCTRS